MSTMNNFKPGDQAGIRTNQLSANLSSNNPFRNRATSPSNPNTNLEPSPFDDPTPRPVSKNPFLDQSAPLIRSPGAISSKSDSQSLSAEDIFNSLTLDEKKPVITKPPTTAPLRQPSELQPDRNRRVGTKPFSNDTRHRPTKSQEEALRARKLQSQTEKTGSARSPQRWPQRRPRRNSESSVLDIEARSAVEDKSKSEFRRHGYDRSQKEGKQKQKSGRPSRRLDIIDQLDATSIYGTGLFHHDGPFDALNPHRNRQSSRRAPMQAFPKDSLNNSIGGAGPLRRHGDHSAFMGNATEEAFRDYATSKKDKNGYEYPVPSSRGDVPIFDPISRGDVVHGEESYGLGTSTFLEGTPAVRTAIARRQAEQAQDSTDGGIQRKKSLAQRIRQINNRAPREVVPSGRLTNPEEVYAKSTSNSLPSGTLAEHNPFFSEFNAGEEKITVRSKETAMPYATPPPVPRRQSGETLERRATTDATVPGEDTPAKPSGLLGRMKSLKGGRRNKNTDIPGNVLLNTGKGT